jgi:hypothetical protein
MVLTTITGVNYNWFNGTGGALVAPGNLPANPTNSKNVVKNAEVEQRFLIDAIVAPTSTFVGHTFRDTIILYKGTACGDLSGMPDGDDKNCLLGSMTSPTPFPTTGIGFGGANAIAWANANSEYQYAANSNALH